MPEKEVTVNMAETTETTVRPYMFEPESDPEWEESAEENPAERFSMRTIP